MGQTKGNRASRILVRHRDALEKVDAFGELLPPPPRVSQAAAKLGRRFVAKHGMAAIVANAKSGGRAVWKGTTALERSIEMRRRRRLGMARKKAKVAKQIKDQLGR